MSLKSVVPIPRVSVRLPDCESESEYEAWPVLATDTDNRKTRHEEGRAIRGKMEYLPSPFGVLMGTSGTGPLDSRGGKAGEMGGGAPGS